jgi:hypothetical protein
VLTRPLVLSRKYYDFVIRAILAKKISQGFTIMILFAYRATEKHQENSNVTGESTK